MDSALRIAIYQRDGGICGICDQPVALDDLDIDHIVHRVVGGDDERENLRATHSVCNRKRGARDVPGAYRQPHTRDLVLSIAVRMTDKLHARVKTFAEWDRRSLNSEILALLEEAMDHREFGTEMQSDRPRNRPPAPPA